MKIEKLNASSLRFTLTKEDLDERDITVNDLVTDSIKTQGFIRELMMKALDEFEFDGLDKPLIVEAAPNFSDGVILTVSKFDKNGDAEKPVSKINTLIPATLCERKFRAEDFEDYSAFSENEFDSEDAEKDYFSRFKKKSTQKTHSEKNKSSNDSRIAIYSFDNIDLLCSACERITNIFSGESSVYKYNKRLFLVINNSNPKDRLILSDIEPVLNEYGVHNQSNSVSKYFLEEHGEVFIEENAVRKASLI